MTSENQAKCPICLCRVAKDEDADLECRHDIHLDCARQTRNDICPVCRTDITPSSSRLTTEELELIQKRRKEDLWSFGFSWFDSDDLEENRHTPEFLSAVYGAFVMASFTATFEMRDPLTADVAFSYSQYTPHSKSNKILRQSAKMSKHNRIPFCRRLRKTPNRSKSLRHKDRKDCSHYQRRR